MCTERYNRITGAVEKVRDCNSCQCHKSATNHDWEKDDSGNWWCIQGGHAR